MPITVKQIAANTGTVSFEVDGEQVTVNYYPARITENILFSQSKLFSGNFQDEQDMRDRFGSFNGILVHLIKGWDVLNEDGTMYPITIESLGNLPLIFRVRVLNEIMEDLRPNEVTPQVTN